MAKRDEFDININIVNPDGNLRAEDLKKRSYDNDKPSFVKEDSSRSVNENVRVQESQRVEKNHSVSSRPTFRKPELNMSFGSMITAIGTTTATVAVSVAVVVAVVVLAFSLSVTLVSATSDSLSFYVLIEQGDGKTFTAYLSQNDTVYQQSILGSDYVTFSNLTPNSEYNLRVVDDADGTEYYNQSFYTLQKSDDRATISNDSLKADGTLAFKVQVKDLKRDEFYTVRVTDGDDNVYLVVDDTAAERDFVLNVGNAKLAYISVAINGTIVCIKQLMSETVVFGEPTFSWTETATGGYTAKATFTCQNDAQHIENVDAVVTSLNVEATCEEGAKIVYTATATLDGREYQDTKSVVTGDPLGHDYGEPEWEWTEVAGGAADGSDIDLGEEIPYTAVAVFTCRRDPSHTMRLDGGDYSYEGGMGGCEEPGTVIYYARVTYNDVEYEGTKEVTVPASGHDYGEPEWNWTEGDNGGYSAVVAVFTCQNNPEHVENVQGEIASQDYDATCDEPAKIVYTATATFGGREYTDTKTITMGDPLGHEYGEPEWEWTEGAQDEEGIPNCTATAVFTCTHDPSHTMRLDAEVSHEGGAPGCEEEGHLIFYASVVYNEVDYQDEREVTAPALGHSYTPVFHWIGSNGSYEAEFYMMCKRQDNFLGPFEAQVTSTAGDGYTLFTATATYDDVEYSETKKELDTIKPLAVGAKYFIGDTIDMGGNTVYFYDDYAGGAHRTNMGNATPVVKMLPAGDSGGATLTFTDILDYDRIILNNDVYARMTDDEYGSYHGSSEETSWRFEAGQGTLVGVTIVSGSGTSEDPYMLAPIYGVSVTYNANGGMFNSIEASNLTLYCEGQDSLAIPPAENPEASGMIFIGWFTDQLQENKFDFENTDITDDITLFAGWMSV